jgi:hypothetical protein
MAPKIHGRLNETLPPVKFSVAIAVKALVNAKTWFINTKCEYAQFRSISEALFPALHWHESNSSTTPLKL